MRRCLNIPLSAHHFLKASHKKFSPVGPAKPHRHYLVGSPFANATDRTAMSKEEQKLPPLSARDFTVYNQAAEKMDYFHRLLRQSWNIMWDAATSGRRPSNLTIRQFIAEGLRFAEHLEIHHSIEETRVFPYLAKKMPEFEQKGRGRKAGELVRQHRQIHAGLEEFRAYLGKCSRGEEELRLGVLREKMESWKDVLWAHLDQEVETLGAENMRRYWTVEEMARIPM